MGFSLFNLFGKRNSIKYKGKSFSRNELNEIIFEEKEDFKYFELDLVNLEFDKDILEGLTKKQIKNFIESEKKSKASTWKSRQRKLRREGKLEKYQINALNKLGMTWNPQYDNWEHDYLFFKIHGISDPIEGWIKEQRTQFEKGIISEENLLRLSAIKFPFKPLKDEIFKITSLQASEMLEAMDNGVRTYIFKREIIKSETEKKSIKKLLPKKHFDDSKVSKLIKEIDKVYANKKRIRKKWGNVDIDKYFALMQYVSGTYIDQNFNKNKFDCPDEVKVYASEKSVELLENKILKTKEFNDIKSFPAINKYISYYDKKRDLEKLIYLYEIVKKYPVLKLIYLKRMQRVMKKYS